MMLLLAVLFASAPIVTVKLPESGAAKVGSAAPSFGGSWCKPCNEGMPRLVGVTKKHPELRLVLIDVESDAQKAQEFAAKMGVDGPAILDKFEQIAKTYGVAGNLQADGKETTALPRTF